MGRAATGIAGYCAVVLTPLLLAGAVAAESRNMTVEIGKACAVTAFMIIFLQFVLAGRFGRLTAPYGLDIVMRFHKYIALFAGVLLVVHPLLIAAGSGKWILLYGVKLPWQIWVGKIALVLLVANLALSVYRKKLRIAFQHWRLGHDILAPLLIVLPFVHSWGVGDEIEDSVLMSTLWAGLPVIALAVFGFHRFARPALLRRRPWHVSDVRRETENVWYIRLVPFKGDRCFDYAPGQFQFITFCRGRGLPVEEHHWTISSSPGTQEWISATIKESGDFTATIGQTRPGDTAVVQGPFGRFSCVFHPGERRLVFIAGGIGITPFMSMLRHIRTTAGQQQVLLLYASSREEDIVFRHELAALEEGSQGRIRVVHVLSDPPAGWQGASGHINRAMLERYCADGLPSRSFYVCGPEGLRAAVLDDLRSLGVARQQVHMELFSFVD